MSLYKITDSELADLIRGIYEEACYGYMDLKESVCDRMLGDFLRGREVIAENPAPTPQFVPQVGGGSYSITIDSPNPGEITASYHMVDQSPPADLNPLDRNRGDEQTSINIRSTTGSIVLDDSAWM